MGSSQSKNDRRMYMDQQQQREFRRQGYSPTDPAIAAYLSKSQRKLLLKRAKQARLGSSSHLAPLSQAAAGANQWCCPQADLAAGMCYATSCPCANQLPSDELDNFMLSSIERSSSSFLNHPIYLPPPSSAPTPTLSPVLSGGGHYWQQQQQHQQQQQQHAKRKRQRPRQPALTQAAGTATNPLPGDDLTLALLSGGARVHEGSGVEEPQREKPPRRQESERRQPLQQQLQQQQHQRRLRRAQDGERGKQMQMQMHANHLQQLHALPLHRPSHRASTAANNLNQLYHSLDEIGSQSSSSHYSSQFSSSSHTAEMIHEQSDRQQKQSQNERRNIAQPVGQSSSHNRDRQAKSLHQLNESLPDQPASHYQHQVYAQMIDQAHYQRGLAYNDEERARHGLLGLLPAAVQDQELQVRGVINFIDHCKDELGKYVYLRHLKDFNEHLFYSALTQNVEKLMPLVYTPTVGLACQKFSEIYMRPRGLFITMRDVGRVGKVLANWPQKDVRVIVVTDGERILGLGDLGANGMGISIGKLSLYTALAGIPPQNVLPITIDVGTNNETFLKDPFYVGLRQTRVRGEQYDALIDEFMKSVVERWGRSCLIQFEDFANSSAFNLLQRYRDSYCTFNDDIQGTASVCLSGLISAAKLIGRRLADCSFLFYGAGEANLGTTNLLVMAMLEEGESAGEARKRIWLVDSKGLVVSSRTDLSGHKRTFAQDAPHLRDLEAIIEHTRPAGIIGASAQGGAFSESICKKMAQFNERPIIFALSNPTSKAECTAQDAYNWTEGRCVFASGSPFDPVLYKGKTFVTGQGNNAYIFPGVGLAAIGAHVHTVPEDTFLVAAQALSDQVTASDTQVGLVYPRLSKIREVTLKVATRVLEHLYSERLATYRPEPDDKLGFLKAIQYDCRYEPDSGRTSSGVNNHS